MNSALVLGGGGMTGIAWELGVLAGLRARGVDLTRSDVIVGTSAGSVVGTLIATGVPLEAAVAQLREGPALDVPAVDASGMMAAFSVLFDTRIEPRAARARVGRMALEAPVGDEASYLTRFTGLLLVHAWPDAPPRLVITGVDAATGESAHWDRTSGVPLVSAVAASCAVPCVFPPVTIGASRYMDGGVRSLANADLAAGARTVVVIAPLGQMMALSWSRERARLGDAASLLIGPDDAALEAIGPNVMDPSRQRAALDAGLAQGERMVDEVRAVVGP